MPTSATTEPEGGPDEASGHYFRSIAAIGQNCFDPEKGLSAIIGRTTYRKGEQREPRRLSSPINPQGVGSDSGGRCGRAILTHSLPSSKWLDETHPEPPLLAARPAASAPKSGLRDGARLTITPAVSNLKRCWRGLRRARLPEDQ